jgi:hypothetical protein
MTLSVQCAPKGGGRKKAYRSEVVDFFGVYSTPPHAR